MKADSYNLLKIFIASPGDVVRERKQAQEEIRNLQPIAQKFGYMLEAVGWETHASLGLGRPQERINPLVSECHLFIGIFNQSFGQPTGAAESGTLEEFNLAQGRYTKEGVPQIKLFFREVSAKALKDPGPQLQKVLDFRKQVEEGNVALYSFYRNERHFAKLLGQQVTQWLLELTPNVSQSAGTQERLASDKNAKSLSAFDKHFEYCRTELQKTARLLRLRNLGLPPLFLEEVNAVQPRSLKVSEAVKKLDRLLILGEPGAGKTTSLKKLAKEYAVWRGEITASNPDESHLPIFVDLSTYPTLFRDSSGILKIRWSEGRPVGVDHPNGLLRLIISSVHEADEIEVRKRLVAGGCLILLDGLDEVGEAYEEVIQQICHLARHEIPNNRFVVTCRNSAYRGKLCAGFATFQLERLTSFNASKILEIELDTETAREAWKRLDEYTRDLCRNPLMLTLLTDELRTGDSPPQNRAQILERFIDRYLLEWACVECGGSVHVEKEILSALAGRIWQRDMSRSVLPIGKAMEAMEARFKELQFPNEFLKNYYDIATLYREFLRHGLLRESKAYIGFFHRAVQEYFFSREVARHQQLDFVLKKVNDPAWAEVLVFVCGMLDDATPVVLEIMKNDANLAARCAANAEYIDDQVVDELAILLIQRLRVKFEKNLGTEKLYQDMLTVLSIESKTQTKDMLEFFRRAYGQSPLALYHFVRLLLETHGPAKAIPFLEPLVDEQAYEVRLRGLLAWALRRGENFQVSLRHYEICLNLEPDNALIWGGKGKTYNAIKEWSKAGDCFCRAIEIDDGLHWAHCHYGFTLVHQENHQEAQKEFQKALELDPDYALAHFALAELYREKLNQPESALYEYESAIQLEQRPERLSKAYFGLVQALDATGRAEEARQQYQQYLDRFPWA